MAPLSKKAKLGAKPVPGGGLNKFFGSSKSGDPAAAPAAAETPAPVVVPVATPTPASQPGGGLTDVQKQRIEENRRKALERQQAKKNGQEPAKVTLPVAGDAQKSPSPLKSVQNADSTEVLKRKGSEITPEKVSMPGDERRVAPAQQENVAARPEEKFTTFGKVPWRQYNDLYAVRLQKLRGAVLAQAKSLWSNDVPANNFLSNITGDSSGSSDIVVIGITFKDMPSRDNVIEQYRDASVATSCLPEDDVDAQKNLCSDADVMWLEDAVFRIELKLKPEQVAKLATGFVAGVRGQVTSDGKFEAKDVCLAQGFVTTPLPAKPEKDASGPYLALLSGLFIGAPDEDVKARNRAVDFLLGRSEAETGAVKHVIVCGGVYHVEKSRGCPTGLADADNMFAQLAQKMSVDVMPGHKDPTNLSLPQMALHPYLFRSAKDCKEFKSVSNPYECTLEELQILGHSGQPVRDLMRCTSLATPMQALTTCLDAQLIAPTAPDTLITQSFDKADPFIIETMPQLFFSAGEGQAEYEWRAASSGDSAGTLCVSVPAFNKHPSLVLVNMRNPRDIQVQEFGA